MNNTEPASRRRFRLGLSVWLCIALLAGALTLVLSLPQRPSAASKALDQKLEELRQRGVPMTANELGRVFPDPPPELNASLVLKEALAWRPGPGQTNLPFVRAGSLQRTEPIAPEVLEAMAAYLTNSSTLIALMPSNLAGVRFPSGMTNWPRVTSMPLVQLRTIAQALALESLLAAEHENPSDALAALRGGFGLAGTCEQELLVGVMFRASFLHLMCNAAEQVLNRVRFNDEQLLAIQNDIHPSRADDLVSAIRCDLYTSLLAYSELRAQPRQSNRVLWNIKSGNWKRWLQGDFKPLYRDEDFLLLIEVREDALQLENLSGLERLRQLGALDSHYSTNSLSALARLFQGRWPLVLRVALETRARMEAAKTAIAIERYRLAHQGAVPPTLDALVPNFVEAIPVDPFDHQPLRFKRLERGYVVYSIGADGIDNGGVERTSNSVTNNYDVTFIVER